jgi:hypothetical protein
MIKRIKNIKNKKIKNKVNQIYFEGSPHWLILLKQSYFDNGGRVTEVNEVVKGKKI